MRIGNNNRMTASTMAYMAALVLALQLLTVLQQQHPAVVHGYQLRPPPRRPSFFFSRFKSSSSTASQPTTTSITPPSSSRSKRNYRNGNDDSTMDETLDEGTASTSTTTSTTTITTKQGKRQRIKKVLASSNPLGRRRNKHAKATVRTVDELRQAILDQGLSLSNVAIVAQQEQNKEQQHPTTSPTTTTTSIPTDFFHNHAVRELIKQRYQQQSMPGHRSVHNDTAVLALSIEGGGMRGCVSAGMVAAIACLGLSDTIDRVYGSSAGSVVGAYLVSRQVCMDVYVDILPAAQKLFVCKTRMMQSLASSLVDVLVKSISTSSLSSWKKNNNNTTAKEATAAAADTHGESPLSSSQLTTTSSSSPPPPGMNISFVLDGILGHDHGIRPLDMDTFRQNDAKQPLRVVSSTIDPETGRLCSKCFGTRDFFDETMAVKKADGTRSGLFACLEASMTVPGATGPPVRLRQSETGKVLPCFDAFCFEPIPYRSAVEEGATHVLVLASRPEEYQPKTRPGVYETGVAPLYFHSHGHGKVGEFFEQGGQQYLYAEDLLALEEAKSRKVLSPDNDEDQKVMVPPAEILYGVPETPETRYSMENRETEWKRAHLMPLRVPRGHKELPTLEQGKDAVLEAVRGGFTTAFDSLSSIVGLEHISGAEAAKLVFPEDDESDMARILGSVMHVPGEEIQAPALQQMMDAIADDNIAADEDGLNDPFEMDQVIHDSLQYPTGLIDGTTSKEDICHHTLLAILPGFQGGRLSHLARGLKNGAATSNREK